MKKINLNLIKPSDADSVDAQADDLAQHLPVILTHDTRWRAYDEDEGYWKDVSRNAYRPVAQAILPKKHRTPSGERRLLDLLEGRWQVSDPKIFKGVLRFEDDALDRVLINVSNGILRVTPDSITLLDHDRRHGFTRILGSKFDATATNPLFLTTLETALPDPLDRDLFRHAVGNFLLPDCRFEVALNCFGEAGSGKDTLANPIIYTLDAGETERGIVTHLSLSQICDPNCYALAKLHYSCVNLCAELDARAIEESANFKKLVSGDSIETREIRQSPFTMASHCKVWSLTNELPRFKHGTAAELRRMRFLPFSQVITRDKIDTTVKERLKRPCSGVLNYILSGLQDCLRLGGRPMPYGGPASKAIHDRFACSNDPLGDFIKAYCQFAPAGHVERRLLHNCFVAYCEQRGFSAEVPEHFFRKLYDRYTQVQGARLGGGDRPYIVKGLVLTPNAEIELHPTNG